MWWLPCGAGARDGVGGANSFVVVEGRGVGITESGDIWYDVGSADPIRVTARAGWLVNGRGSVTLEPSSGTVGGLRVVSRLDEDSQHIHVFPCETANTHVRDVEICAQANPASLAAVYAVPDAGAVVAASASTRVDVKGLHHWTRRYSPCACGESMSGPSCEEWDEEVVPDRYEWTATAAGLTFNLPTWTGTMTKGLGQAVGFNVTGKRDACLACACHAQAAAEVDVFELSIERPDYLGLDMTDAMKGMYVTRTATVKIDPEPQSATYNWTDCGRCSFFSATDGVSVTYGGNDETGASGSYLEEPLTVSATVWNKDGRSASAACTTNFTVVAVDVSVGGAGEGTEETSPPSVIYSRELTKFAIDNMKPVKIICEPKDLPGTELVWLTLSDNIDLFEKNESGVPVRATKSSFKYNEIGGKTFWLLGRPPYEEIQDGVNGTVTVEHYGSGAKDLAKVKVVPPPPLLITNVQFLSPSSKNNGAWPYDPVWDDDDWELTVDGSVAVKCANDTDEGQVSYTLNRDADSVKCGIYKIGVIWDDIVYALDDSSPSEGEHLEKWVMPIRLPVGDYCAKVEAVEKETGVKRNAKSNEGAVRRECIYCLEDEKPPMSVSAYMKVTKSEELVSDVEHWVVKIVLLNCATYAVKPVVAGWAATWGFIKYANVASWGAGLAVEESVSRAVGGISEFDRAGTQRAFYSWHVTRYDWVGNDYVMYRKPNPNYNPDNNGQRPLVGQYQIGYFEPKFVMSIEMDRGRDRNEDGSDKERTVYMSYEKGADEGNEDTKFWHWEPNPYDGGYGLKEPELISVEWDW